MQYVDDHWGVCLAAALACLLPLLFAVPSLGADHPDNRFLTAAHDRAFIMRTLERERQYAASSLPVTGITVPHHLLAADLIARGVLAASAGTYDRVVIISPDHFLSLKTPFGITTEDLQTATGVLVADRLFAQKALAASNMFSDIGAAPREHGIHAITPFIRAIFPEVRIVAITTATNCTPGQLRAAAELLANLVRPKTLIVQSTDYSHFLPGKIAALRDQETVAALASGDPRTVLSLTQPNHMDSRASQFLQMTLQRNLYKAAPVIVANRNAYDYISGSGPTTTYIVTVFTPTPEHGWRLDYPDQTVMYFGGDTYIGPAALRPAAMDRLARRVKEFTGNFPLVVNLNGVVLDERPAGSHDSQHFMLSRLVLPLLKKLGVTAVNSANDRAYDFDQKGLDESARLLEAGGFRVLRHDVATHFGAVNIVPLTFKRNYSFDHAFIGSASQLESICALQDGSPVIVLANWGAHYADKPGPFENDVLNKLVNCGVSALIGARSHRASTRTELRAGGALQSVISMGNLIYEQTGPDSSGSMVELRVFRRGTIALRVVPIPNFFEMFKSSNWR